MASNEGFQFKQFYVRHDRCAMKVGTDGVLLGAWAGSDIVRSILDVGTGSGLIALMLAQRFPNAHIDAIDIDEAAVEQAAENFAASSWSDKLYAYCSKLQDWHIVHRTSPLCTSGYDLIVSNPPYFRDSLKNPDSGRKTARHTDSLSFEDLLFHSTRLLSSDGHLALILPAEAEAEICRLAAACNLLPARITRVFSKESKPARRVLLQFVKSPHSLGTLPVEDTLVLEDDKGGRSRLYQELAKDFYL